MALSAEQIEFRKGGIGGSDAAVVLGVSPWKSALELWLEKTGQVEDTKESTRLSAGSFLEPFIAAEVQRGRVIAHGEGRHLDRICSGKQLLGEGGEMLTHPDHPFMLANTDRTIGGAKVGDRWIPSGILEIKTAGEWAFKRGWGQGVPLYYQVQCQHYMAVTGARFAIVACLEGLERVHVWELKRDDHFIIERLIPKLADFWAKVESKTPPQVDDSDSCARALRLMYPEPEPAKVIDLGEDADRIHAIANEHALIGKEIRGLAAARRGLANQLAAAFQDAEEVHMGDGTIIKKQKSGKGYTYKVEEPKEVVA